MVQVSFVKPYEEQKVLTQETEILIGMLCRLLRMNKYFEQDNIKNLCDKLQRSLTQTVCSIKPKAVQAQELMDAGTVLTDEQKELLEEALEIVKNGTDPELKEMINGLDEKTGELDMLPDQKEEFDERLGRALHARLMKAALVSNGIPPSIVDAMAEGKTEIDDDKLAKEFKDACTKPEVDDDDDDDDENEEEDEDEEEDDFCWCASDIDENERFHVNMDANLRQGGRKAPKGGRNKLKKIKDVYEFLDFDNAQSDKVREDLEKYKFDLENREKICRGTTKHGIDYIAVYGGGDWETPVLFFIYWDGKHYRGYVPLKGNAINTRTKAAFGNNDESDEKFVKEQCGEDADVEDVGFCFSAGLEDFEVRLEVRE